MARRATALRADRSEFRQTVEGPRLPVRHLRNEGDVTAWPERDSWALYLLEREFYGLPPEARGRTPSSHRAGRPKSSS